MVPVLIIVGAPSPLRRVEKHHPGVCVSDGERSFCRLTETRQFLPQPGNLGFRCLSGLCLASRTLDARQQSLARVLPHEAHAEYSSAAAEPR
jgi:hypothetical protein